MGGDTVLETSPLFKNKYAEAWVSHDVETANKLLDEFGLDKRGLDNVRLLPDGRPMEIIVESAGEFAPEVDALELIRYHWEELGIKTFTRSLQCDILRRRFLTGETLISISKGLNIGLATPELNPEELARFHRRSRIGRPGDSTRRRAERRARHRAFPRSSGCWSCTRTGASRPTI